MRVLFNVSVDEVCAFSTCDAPGKLSQPHSEEEPCSSYAKELLTELVTFKGSVCGKDRKPIV